MSIAASTVRQQLPQTASRRPAPAEHHAAAAEGAIGFGPFRLLPTRRLLLAGDLPVPVGSRAMDLLIALVERPGELIGKDELLARAWLACSSRRAISRSRSRACAARSATAAAAIATW